MPCVSSRSTEWLNSPSGEEEAIASMHYLYYICRLRNSKLHLSGCASWPRGPMDKASDFESEDCEFESRRGQSFLFEPSHEHFQKWFIP